MPERHPPDLRWSVRRFPDPERSADPGTQAVLTALRTLPTPVPREPFRTELRTQLVAITPRLVAEGVSEPEVAPRRSRWQETFDRLSPSRPFAVLASAMTVLAVLLTSAVWISRHSVPGDPLYSVKRARENVALSLTGGEAARAGKRLDLAQTRVTEVLTLWTDSVPATPAPAVADGAGATADLMATTLSDADAEIRTGSRALGEQAVRDNTAAPLLSIIAWAPGQIARLGAIAAAIPPSPLHDRALASEALAKRALARATALKATLGCQCLSATGSDDLGPLPCTSCAPATVPGAPGAPSSSVSPVTPAAEPTASAAATSADTGTPSAADTPSAAPPPADVTPSPEPPPVPPAAPAPAAPAATEVTPSG